MGDAAERTTADEGIGVVNLATGEHVFLGAGIEDQLFSAILQFAETLQKQKDGKKSRTPTWVAVVESATRSLTMNPKVTHAEVRVWTALVVNLDYGGRLKLTQQGLAESANVKRGTVNRAFAKFVKYDLLEKVKPLPGSTLCWKVKPTAAKKGHRSIPEAKELARQSKVASIAQARAGDNGVEADAA